MGGIRGVGERSREGKREGKSGRGYRRKRGPRKDVDGGGTVMRRGEGTVKICEETLGGGMGPGRDGERDSLRSRGDWK